MKKPGITYKRHKELASMFVTIDEVLAPLCVEIGNSYNLKSKQVNDINAARNAISKVKSSLEDAMFGQYPELPDSDIKVYYPQRPRTDVVNKGTELIKAEANRQVGDNLGNVFTAKELGETNLDMNSAAEHETAYRRGYYHALCHHQDKLIKVLGEHRATSLCDAVYEWRREAYKGDFCPPPQTGAG